MQCVTTDQREENSSQCSRYYLYTLTNTSRVERSLNLYFSHLESRVTLLSTLPHVTNMLLEDINLISDKLIIINFDKLSDGYETKIFRPRFSKVYNF